MTETKTAAEPAPDIGRAQLEKMLEQLEGELRNYEQAALMTKGAINTVRHMLQPVPQTTAAALPTPSTTRMGASDNLPANRKQRRAERKKRAA